MNWLQVLGPSLLMVLGGLLTWLIKSRIEELRAIEEKLRETRRDIYNQILVPYIVLFCDMTTKGKGKVGQMVTSEQYRKTAFDLNLFGSDEVVRAYNSLMSYAYRAEAKDKQYPKKIVLLWGSLLL